MKLSGKLTGPLMAIIDEYRSCRICTGTNLYGMQQQSRYNTGRSLAGLRGSTIRGSVDFDFYPARPVVYLESDSGMFCRFHCYQ